VERCTKKQLSVTQQGNPFFFESQPRELIAKLAVVKTFKDHNKKAVNLSRLTAFNTVKDPPFSA
jgi:hypothetical protein